MSSKNKNKNKKDKINFIDKIKANTDLTGKVKIDGLGRIEIIDDQLLADISGGELGLSDLCASYLNVSCNGNSSCC